MSARTAVAAPLQQIQRARALVPRFLVPRLVERGTNKAFATDWARENAEGQMRWLLELTHRADEVSQLARDYLYEMTLRRYLRWHPAAVTHQPVHGIEWLTTSRDRSRPMILNFMHHGRYDGMFASVTNAGAPLEKVLSPMVLTARLPVELKQHAKVMAMGGPVHSAEIGTDAIVELMRPGVLMAIASDVPSRTEVTFLGRRVLGSSGAPRIATTTDSLVAVITAHQDGSGGYLQVHEPLDPRHFADPLDLLEAMLRLHEAAVLAWPEAVDVPTARFAELGSGPLTAPWMTG